MLRSCEGVGPDSRSSSVAIAPPPMWCARPIYDPRAAQLAGRGSVGSGRRIIIRPPSVVVNRSVRNSIYRCLAVKPLRSQLAIQPIDAL